MGKRRYKKHKKMREDYGSIQAAGKKRGLWSSIGSTLLGGAAMLATGGAAAPLVAGAMAAGGSFAGGHIGNWFAGKTKGGKLTGTKWYGSVGKEVGSQIKEGINVKAMKSGLNTMLMAGGGKVTSKLFGKGGTTVTPQTAGGTGTNKLADYTKGLVKGGDKGSQTGLGRLIDFEGSTLHEGMNKMGSMMDSRKIKKLQAGEGLVPTGQGEQMIGTGELPRGKGGVPDLDKMFAEELELPATEGFLDSDVYRAQMDQAGNITSRDMRDTFGDISRTADRGEYMPGGVAREIDMSKYIGEKVDVPFTGSKVTASQAQESAILKNELKDFQFSDQLEGFRSDAGSKRTPFSGGGGTDFTQTSAWEGVGESFPVSSPDFVRSEGARAAGASQYSAGKGAAFDTERHKRMQQSMGWQDRLFRR